MKTEIRKNTPADYETAYMLTRELMVHHNALDIFTTTPERLRGLIEIRFTATETQQEL